MAVQPDYAADTDPAAVCDERACEHRARALAHLNGLDVEVALVYAVLALESRIDELAVYVARLT